MAKIQFENKVALNENASIPDVNKCKATDMNEIKSVVNENDDLIGNLSSLNTTEKSNLVGAINEVYQNNVYSTDETVVGKWIDGKPIYRKVFEIGSLPNDTTISIPHGIKNLDTFTDKRASWYDSIDDRWNFDYRKDSNTVIISFNPNNTNLYIRATGTDWSRRTSKCTVTLEYKKTTD